jgi:hypothetical protein
LEFCVGFKPRRGVGECNCLAQRDIIGREDDIAIFGIRKFNIDGLKGIWSSTSTAITSLVRDRKLTTIGATVPEGNLSKSSSNVSITFQSDCCVTCAINNCIISDG